MKLIIVFVFLCALCDAIPVDDINDNTTNDGVLDRYYDAGRKKVTSESDRRPLSPQPEQVTAHNRFEESEDSDGDIRGSKRALTRKTVRFSDSIESNATKQPYISQVIIRTGLDPPRLVNQVSLIEAFERNEPTQLLSYLATQFERQQDVDDCMIRASALGYQSLVSLLLSKGANIHARNDRAIYASAKGNHADLTRYLLMNGGSVSAGLEGALQGDSVSALSILCAEQTVHVQRILELAVANGKLKSIVYLIRLFDYPLHSTQMAQLMRLASQMGQFDALRLLFEMLS